MDKDINMLLVFTPGYTGIYRDIGKGYLFVDIVWHHIPILDVHPIISFDILHILVHPMISSGAKIAAKSQMHLAYHICRDILLARCKLTLWCIRLKPDAPRRNDSESRQTGRGRLRSLRSTRSESGGKPGLAGQAVWISVSDTFMNIIVEYTYGYDSRINWMGTKGYL